MLRRIKIAKRPVIVTFLLLVGLGISGGGSVSAQTHKRLAATPRAFQTFYAKFRRAVVARDKNTVASLTRFPFKYGFDAGDEGTFSKAQFLKRFSEIFGTEPGIFSRRSPSFNVDRGSFELYDESDASHYIFEKRGSGYQFTAYIAEP